MKQLFGDKAFLKKLAALAIPISLQSLIASSLGIVDQMMIGQLGKNIIAGVGFGGRIPFIFMMTLFGIVSATSIYTAQYFGKGDMKEVGKVVGTTLVIGSLVTAVFMAIALVFTKQAVRLFTGDEAVISQGVIYLKYVSIGFIPMMISQTYSAVLRSTHRVRLPLIAGLISFGVNTLLNYVLIFGNFGAPELGIMGAALATGISRTIEMIILLAVVYIRKYEGAIRITQLFTFDPKFVKAFMITSLPLLFNEFLWSLGESVYTGIYGHMGTAEAAGMTMTFPLQSFSIAFFVGISSAAGILLGNKLGAGEEEEAYLYAKRFIAIGITGAVLISLVIIGISPLYLRVFKVDAETAGHFSRLIVIFSMVLFVKVSNMIIGGGILRSGGETKLTMYLDMIGGWCIGIPLGLLTSRVFGLPVHYVYFFISLEEVFRLIVGLVWTNRKIWIKNLVADPV